MTAVTICKLLRVRQWLKNLMLFFPPFLGGTLFSTFDGSFSFRVLCAFSLVSSATYILNDIVDKEHDRYHPEKRTRPIASGQITIVSALSLSALLLVGGCLLALTISSYFFFCIICYVALSVCYSLKLKQLVLVDIFCISAGFLLRLQAGGAAFNVTISEWLFLSVFLLSLFLSAGKRVAERKQLGNDALIHRKALASYPDGYLEGSMLMTGGAVLVTYALYVINRHSPVLLVSVPLCCFGLLRYSFRVQSGKGGDPTDSLLKDLPLLMVGMVWAVMIGWVTYGG